MFEVGQLAQGGGLDGGKFAAYKLLQPPAVPCQKRPSCIEVVGDDAFMMSIVAWFILCDTPRLQAARVSLLACAGFCSGLLPSIKSAALTALAAATAAATSMTAR